LTYASAQTLSIGSIISVPLKNTVKDAVVIAEVQKPEFQAAEIIAVSDRYYLPGQMAIGNDGLHRSSISLSEKPTPLKYPALSDAQQYAYEQLLQKDRALLFGVTGAGKTEIFIALMAKMLEEGKTTIFLMPEISLTPQMEKRLKVYFGDAVAMWHSKITKKKKEQILEGIESGRVRIIAGARSALFTPIRDVGLYDKLPQVRCGET